MTEDLKSKIRKIVEQERITSKNLFVFEQIPPKKLSNAVNSYALPFDSGESIIMLYDDTAFGSAKQGFILTSKRLYSRNTDGKSVCVDIVNITKIDHTCAALGKITMFIETPRDIFAINAVQIVAKNHYSLPSILYQTIKLVHPTEDLATATSYASSNQMLRCRGCGAMNAHNADSCEYCGGTDFAVQGGAPAATTVSGKNHYYKECPGVPDFGAAVGIPLLRIEDSSVAPSLDICYYYNKRDVSQEKIDAYIKLAKENGIGYDGYNSELNVHTFSPGNQEEQEYEQEMGIFMPYNSEECYLQLLY